MPSIKQNTDGSTGLVGPGGGNGGFVALNMRYDANSVNQVHFVAHRRYIVHDVSVWPAVAGTDAGAVNVSVKVAPSGTAVNSGVKVHQSTGDLKGTANTVQQLQLANNVADRILAAGSGIGLDFSGVKTSIVGTVSVTLAPA